MFKKKLAFIGAGNMATAIACGMIRNRVLQSSQCIASDVDEDRRLNFSKITTIPTITDNIKAAREAEIVMLCIKP